MSHAVFWSGMAFLGFLQVTAVVLNLLPIPGLDGYGALEPHLSPETQRALAARQAVGLSHPAHPADRAAAEPVVLLGSCTGCSTFPASIRATPAIGSHLTRFWSAWF